MFVKVRRKLWEMDNEAPDVYYTDEQQLPNRKPNKAVYHTAYLNSRYILRASPLEDNKTVELYHNDGELYYYSGTIDEFFRETGLR